MNTNLPAVVPGKQYVGIGFRCPAALSSVYSAAPQPSAGELKFPAAAETAGPWKRQDPPSDEPD